MNTGTELLSHISDLAQRCYRQNVYTFSDFLTLGEQSRIISSKKDLIFVPMTWFGGTEGCERRMVRFGSPEMLGYEESFPISTLVVSPLNEKFADNLTHRDFLGAIMNLGIDRSMIGDIVVRGNKAYVFCKEQMAPYLEEHLIRIKHTSVQCVISVDCPPEAAPQLEKMDINVSSERCDAVVAGVYNISRNRCADLFKGQMIFMDGLQCIQGSSTVKEGTAVSVRGFGKFIYDGLIRTTRKDRLVVRVRRYV